MFPRFPVLRFSVPRFQRPHSILGPLVTGVSTRGAPVDTVSRSSRIFSGESKSITRYPLSGSVVDLIWMERRRGHVRGGIWPASSSCTTTLWILIIHLLPLYRTVCVSVYGRELCGHDWSNRDAVWGMDSRRTQNPCIRLGLWSLTSNFTLVGLLLGLPRLGCGRYFQPYSQGAKGGLWLQVLQTLV